MYVRFDNKLNFKLVIPFILSQWKIDASPCCYKLFFPFLCLQTFRLSYLEKSDLLHKKEKTKRCVPNQLIQTRVAKPDVENTICRRYRKNPLRSRIKGRFRLSSYSNFSSTDTPVRQKLRYTLSLSAINPNGSKFSAETYTSFSHELDNWAEIQKMYSVDLKYIVLRSNMMPVKIPVFGWEEKSIRNCQILELLMD